MKRLEEMQRSTVRDVIQDSVTSYEEKPRDQWLFDYPAQVALTGSQIWWTTEVGDLASREELADSLMSC